MGQPLVVEGDPQRLAGSGQEQLVAAVGSSCHLAFLWGDHVLL